MGPVMKFMPLLGTPATVTTTLPLVAPDGTGATILVALQLVGKAVAPLKVSALSACVAPKLAPEILTSAPAPAELGLRLVILGAVETLVAAARKAAKPAPQMSEAANVALAEAGPALA